MCKYNFGFIGAGNMGGALIRAACQGMDAGDIILTDMAKDKAAALAASLGCDFGSNVDVASNSKFIFLGVKPQVMASMLADIAPVLRARKDNFVLVSMAAGLTISQIRAMADADFPVIRIMPNTAVSIDRGMILYAAADNVDADDVAALLSGLSHAGKFDELSESLVDAGSAVCSCGPAYFYMFIEALADGGVAAGLPRAKALEYAAQTALGAGHMIIESGMHPGQLKDAVCSPGGSTIMGVKALEDGGLRAAAINAVINACERSKELGK